MSLPREWNLQEVQVPAYCPIQQDSTCGLQHLSHDLTCSLENNREQIYKKCITKEAKNGTSEGTDSTNKVDNRFAVACSQPESSSLLTECRFSSGSLFSIVSAPPLPVTELNVKEIENVVSNVVCVPPYATKFSSESINVHKASQCSTSVFTVPKRPCMLSIEKVHSSVALPCKALHSSLLQHQISEIEEDDNENLLTVSSITAKPLIEISRELRSALQSGKQSKNGKIKAVPNRTNIQIDDPPDGGYGWFIVFGAFSVQFWVAGLVKSYGVLYVEIMESFPNSTATVASWIPAILSALCLALAPLSSALCQKYSCRLVVFIGGLFCALGLSLSYFATSLLHLLLTFGILTGIGGGLSTTPGIVIVSQYFEKHRALANGICVSGTAAGSFFLPILIKHLAEKFGFHGTILILGGCMFHVCLSSILYKPVKSLGHESHKNVDISDTYIDDYQNGKKFCIADGNHSLSERDSGRKIETFKPNRINDGEFKDIIDETIFMKPIKKVQSSSILHSVEDLSTDSTWVYRKQSGNDSKRGSRRLKNIFANDEIVSKIRTHLENPLSPPAVVTRGLSKSMELPTPVSNLQEAKEFCVLNKRNKDDLNTENDDCAETCCEIIETYLDLSLLKDCSFILMCFTVTLMSVGCPYMLYYLPAHVISIGYKKSEAGYLVAVSAILDLIGRLGLGWLCDLQLFDRRKAYILCILGAGIAVLTIPSEYSLYFVGLSAATYGLCLGSWYVLMPVLLADMFGTDRIGSSYGLVRLFQSIGAISVPPLAGLLRDISGSYEICFYCMGSCMILGCLPFLAWSVVESKRK